MAACPYDSCYWNETSNLRLTVERPSDWMGAFVPIAQLTAPVDYCRRCGAIRLRPSTLALINAADLDVVEQACRTCRGEGVIETGQTSSARCVDCAGTGRTGGEPPNKPLKRP